MRRTRVSMSAVTDAGFQAISPSPNHLGPVGLNSSADAFLFREIEPFRQAAAMAYDGTMALNYPEAPPLPLTLELAEDPATAPAEQRSCALLELIAMPAAVCDTNSAILASNLMMDQILAGEDGLFARAGMLKCTLGADSLALQRAIRSLTACECDHPRDCTRPHSQVMRISRASTAEPLIVALSTLASREPTKQVREVLLRIVSTTPRPAMNVASLCYIFNLTRSEASLSVALVQTGNLTKAATACGITTGSARQYMKRIFAKTSTNSQVQLLSLLLHYPIF